MSRPPDQPSRQSLQGGHLRKNEASRGLWNEFQVHRRRVTDLLLAASETAAAPATDKPRLVVLGAGNCNDLDLTLLRGRFAAIDLVDCDGVAVLQGIARQQLTADSAIRFVGPIDLANFGPIAIPNQLAPPPPPIALRLSTEPARVAASVCLLSQILDDVASCLGTSHSHYEEAVRQVRLAHFQLLVDLLVPGGTGVLVTDVVSSDSAPQLASATPLTLPRLVQDLITQRNFFSGLNPAVIYSLLTTHSDLAPRINDVSVLKPWLWNLGQRVYAVYAVQFRRAK
jgi:hypothetical protein